MKIGDEKIIVLQKNFFPNDRNLPLCYAFLTITDIRHDVPGDYTRAKTYDGYRAIGTDGHIYTCQWERFDETSMSPYSNWRREAIEGRDYIKDGPWIGDDVDLFIGWDLVLTLNQFGMERAQQIYLKEPFSDYIKYCDAIHKMKNGKLNTDPSEKHNRWFYIKEGCPYCQCGL